MKNSIFKKILEKREKLLDKKLFELSNSDAYQFIELDVALLINERNSLRMALRSCKIDGSNESHVIAMIEEILDDDDL